MNAKKSITGKLARWVSGACLLMASTFAAAEEPKPVVIGWMSWADAEITVKLANKALEDKLKQPVKLVMADIGIQFQALSAGKVDVIPMAWIKIAHQRFWDKYKDNLEDLGMIYPGRLGLAVPDIVPASEVSSIADLAKPEVKAKLDGKILTDEAGNGHYKMALRAIEDYKLDGYKLVNSSEAGMLKQLDRNLARNEWSVVNAWSPHWMFQKWPLRYLDDPKEVFGQEDEIHAIARKGFTKDFPQVAHFFTNFKIPSKDLEMMMNEARESSTDAVVEKYYAANKAKFDAMFDAGSVVQN